MCRLARLLHAFDIVTQHGIDARLVTAALRLEEVEQVLVNLDRNRLLLGLLRVDGFPELVIERRMIGVGTGPLLDLFLAQATDAVPIGLLLDGAIATIILALQDCAIGQDGESDWVSHNALAPCGSKARR